MAVNLTPGAISKLLTGEETVREPVVQVIDIKCIETRTEVKSNGVKKKKSYDITLSDGSVCNEVIIDEKIDKMIRSNKLQKGSVVQLTHFSSSAGFLSTEIVVLDLIVLGRECNIIGDPKLIPDKDVPLVERTTPTIPDEDQIHANSHHGEEPPTSKQKQDHVDSLLNENIDNSHHVEEPPTSVQNPSTSTQKCSSHSPTKNKKRKLQSSDDAISVSGKDISDVMKMMVKITNDVRVLYKKVETLAEDVSKMTRMMMEKNKEDDMGACIEKLDKMGWGEEEPTYDTALLLFLKRCRLQETLVALEAGVLWEVGKNCWKYIWLTGLRKIKSKVYVWSRICFV